MTAVMGWRQMSGLYWCLSHTIQQKIDPRAVGKFAVCVGIIHTENSELRGKKKKMLLQEVGNKQPVSTHFTHKTANVRIYAGLRVKAWNFQSTGCALIKRQRQREHALLKQLRQYLSHRKRQTQGALLCESMKFLVSCLCFDTQTLHPLYFLSHCRYLSCLWWYICLTSNKKTSSFAGFYVKAWNFRATESFHTETQHPFYSGYTLS